jgi:hypothetical protein
LYEERGEHLAEIGVGPEEVTGCVEPILSEANLGPKDITIRDVHVSEVLLRSEERSSLPIECGDVKRRPDEPY